MIENVLDQPRKLAVGKMCFQGGVCLIEMRIYIVLDIKEDRRYK